MTMENFALIFFILRTGASNLFRGKVVLMPHGHWGLEDIC